MRLIRVPEPRACNPRPHEGAQQAGTPPGSGERGAPFSPCRMPHVRGAWRSPLTYESAAAHASRTRSGKRLSAPYGRRDSGVGGPGSHARPSAAFECYSAGARDPALAPVPAAHVSNAAMHAHCSTRLRSSAHECGACLTSALLLARIVAPVIDSGPHITVELMGLSSL